MKQESILDTLNNMLKSPDLQFLPFIHHLPNSFLILLRSISGLIVILFQSCGLKTAFGLPISPETSSQQTCFWRQMKKIPLYNKYFKISQKVQKYRVSQKKCCNISNCHNSFKIGTRNKSRVSFEIPGKSSWWCW